MLSQGNKHLDFSQMLHTRKDKQGGKAKKLMIVALEHFQALSSELQMTRALWATALLCTDKNILNPILFFEPFGIFVALIRASRQLIFGKCLRAQAADKGFAFQNEPDKHWSDSFTLQCLWITCINRPIVLIQLCVGSSSPIWALPNYLLGWRQSFTRNSKILDALYYLLSGSYKRKLCVANEMWICNSFRAKGLPSPHQVCGKTNSSHDPHLQYNNCFPW